MADSGAASRALAAPAPFPLPVNAASVHLKVDSVEIPADPYGFEAKYAAFDSAQILGALEAIDSVLAAQREARFVDKSQALPAEELAALELEQQWLKQKTYP